MTNLSSIGEFGLIRQIRKGMPLAKSVVVGIGDDAAVMELNRDKYLLLTTDLLIEGQHFERRTSPELIGRKALACSISDIAAMGGEPTYAVVSLGVSSSRPLSYVMKIYNGMKRLARQFGVSIVGGDTVKSSSTMINVALTGQVEKKYCVTRGGAKPGDVIFVTGPLGNSLKSGRHLKFQPRIVEARYLVKHFLPTSMIDISDGLASDLGHILEMSGVGAVLGESQIPLNRGARFKNALTDGEDFELLFTVSPKFAQRMTTHKLKFPFYRIGTILPSRKDFWLIDRQGQRKTIKVQGYKHF